MSKKYEILYRSVLDRWLIYLSHDGAMGFKYGDKVMFFKRKYSGLSFKKMGESRVWSVHAYERVYEYIVENSEDYLMWERKNNLSKILNTDN